MDAINYHTLKARQRGERDGYPTNLALRVHRALSWLNRAEQADDPDGRFIFLWIAFNAAYTTEIDEHSRLTEQLAFINFLKKLCDLDSGRRIESTDWQKHSSAIRNFLNSPFVSKSIWPSRNGRIIEDEWQERFASSKYCAALLLLLFNCIARAHQTYKRLKRGVYVSVRNF